MTLLNSNSGIITDIKPVITSSFTNITLWYESNNGYCCLYKAQKSGKYHILKTLKPIYKDNPVYQGLKQNVNRYSQSTNIYNQIVQQAQHITELRCQKLYDWYDAITTQDSLSLWLKEYNNLVREVNQQVDPILKQNISTSDPEYHLYKTSLNKLVENIWIDYFYKNQNKLLTSPPALKIHNE